MALFLSNISVVPSWLWPSFVIAVVALLVIDLSLFGHSGHKTNIKMALVESGIWIAVALCFNLWFAIEFGANLGLEFFTGYLVEKSLSVDNLFVILLIFSAFKIPDAHQHRVLFYGVLGAIVLRAIFIILGAQLLHAFHWVLYLFGLVLLITAVKLLREDGEQKVDVTDSFSVRLFKRLFKTTNKFNGNNFFLIEDGVKRATPLFLALVVIEVSDIVFAVDSIPAVFAVTRDAFVAFASNILAILGLRALYFVLADWVLKLRYLKPGLAAILGFIGVKMLIADFVKIPSLLSLIVIFSVLLIAWFSSYYVAKLERPKN